MLKISCKIVLCRCTAKAGHESCSFTQGKYRENLRREEANNNGKDFTSQTCNLFRYFPRTNFSQFFTWKNSNSGSNEFHCSIQSWQPLSKTQFTSDLWGGEPMARTSSLRPAN